MKKSHYYLFLNLLLFIKVSVTYAQDASKQLAYKDFALHQEEILLLTNKGQLKFITDTKSDSGSFLSVNAPVVAMGFDRAGNIVVGDTNHLISQFDQKQKTWRVLAHYTNELLGLVFDSRNRCLAITNRGIVDTETNQGYFPDSAMYLNNQIRNRKQWFGPPAYLIDNEDRIWIGYGYGEWGGNLFVFDAIHKQYLRPQLNTYKITLNPVQAFTQGGKNVFMTTGMAHFITHGSILSFDSLTARVVLNSESQWQPISPTAKRLKGGEYIGPITYNTNDRHLYFYSQNGIFKGNPATDLSKIDNWSLVFKPQLQWTNGQRNAVGPAMNVLKMQFMDTGKLLLLTEHEGVGIYDGKTLRFIR